MPCSDTIWVSFTGKHGGKNVYRTQEGLLGCGDAGSPTRWISYKPDGITWFLEQQDEYPSDKLYLKRFGARVDISGTTVIAANNTDGGAGNGNVFIFVDTGASTPWVEQQAIELPNTVNESVGFCVDVAIDGDTAVMGAYTDDEYGVEAGAAYVYTRTAGVWSLQQKIIPSEVFDGYQFGYSVDISGDTIIAGAPKAKNSPGGNAQGAAYVFTRAAGTWTQQQKFTASDIGDGYSFGQEVSLENDTTVVGAPDWYNDWLWVPGATKPGAAYVFTRTLGVWSQQQRLLSSTESFDRFGTAISLSGNYVAIGAPKENSNAGAAYVWMNSGGTWSEQQRVVPDDAAAGLFFATTLYLDGTTLIVGQETYIVKGAAYYFKRSNVTWQQQQKLVVDCYVEDTFGYAVALDGVRLVISAPRASYNYYGPHGVSWRYGKLYFFRGA